MPSTAIQSVSYILAAVGFVGTGEDSREGVELGRYPEKGGKIEC
jgi:hypothetical protein